nr:protein FAR1-related sequence 5 [Tanacetum cinerariifolium]
MDLCILPRESRKPVKKKVKLGNPLFVVIDNHRKCVTIAAGLLKNETTKSYIWLLKPFMKAFGKSPSIVVTDQDGAMRNVIKSEFGGSKHCLCMWHITKKLHAKICAKIYDETNFKEKLNKIVRNMYIGPKEFEYRWGKLMEEFNLKKKKPQSEDKGKDKVEEDDTVDLFFKKDGLYKVLRNVGDGSIVCSCQLFLRVGILCKHIFCVFKNANVEMIPQQYILRRWTKNLIHAALRNKRNKYGVFVENLKSLKKKVEADCPNPPSKNKTDNLEQLVGVLKPPVVDVNNPTVGSTKGQKRLHIKGGKEKAIDKSLKVRNSCSLCGVTDHNKRKCPGRYEGQDEVVVQKELCQDEVV